MANAPIQTQNQTPSTTDAPEKPLNPALDKVLKGFRDSKRYTEGGFWDTWLNCWKLYNGERVAIGYDGFADTFIPETYTEVQGIKAHLINGDLSVNFMPTSPDQKQNADTLQDLFNYAWYLDYMDQKLDESITEYLVTGNCYVWSSVGENGFPTQRVVSAKDCFFDTQITNYEELCKYGYGGYRYITTLDDLKAATVVNSSYNDTQESTGSNTPTKLRYSNLAEVGEFAQDSDDQTAKQEREDMLAGAVLEDEEGLVECILYFDNERMITVANRCVVIEDVPTPFQRTAQTIQSVDDNNNPVSFELPAIDPFIPVAPFRNLIDTNLWYARSDVEVIADSQERLNDVRAQKFDNLTYQLNRMWALDPAFAQKLDEIQSVPGAVFTIPPGALEQIVTAPIGADADNEVALLKSEMQGATGANESYMGTIGTSGRQSAYQINQELVALGARFAVKVKNLENEAMRILAQNMWKIMQIYINKEIPVRVAADTGGPTNWKTYNPGLYMGDWDVEVKLGVTADTIKETQRQQAMQFYLLASKQPFINQQSLFVMVVNQIFDITTRDANDLIVPPPPPAPIPTAAAALASTIQFGTDLYPDEQAEVLQELDIQPSPYRQDATGINASVPEPSKITANLGAINPANGTSQNTPNQAFEQAGVQTAGSPPVGAPTSGVANMPKVPS